MNIELIRTRLGDVEYSTTGKGTPVLFAHGGHSNCRDVLCHKGLDLERFRLITPSRPGYGQTPLNNNKTPRQCADLFVELVDSLSLDEVVVYGVSAGGLTAIELAANYPDRVSRLILASAISGKWLDEKSSTYRIARLIFDPRVEGATWGLVRLFSALFPQLMARSFFSQFSTSTTRQLSADDVRELVKTLKHYRSRTGFVNDIDQDIEDGVPSRIACPTLIVHSRNDKSVSPDHAEHSNEMIKNSTLELIDNEWGHLLWMGKDSRTTAKMVTKFLD